MHENGNGNGKLKLSDARELTPPVNPVEAMRRQLSLAAFDAVKPGDVMGMVNKLKEQAQAGDLKAMKMYFEIVGVMGKQAAPPPSQEGAGMRMMAEALGDLVAEIRAAKARPALPAGRQAQEARSAHLLSALSALGRGTTLEGLRSHLREDGEDCTPEEYQVAWDQLWGGEDDLGRRLRPPPNAGKNGRNGA